MGRLGIERLAVEHLLVFPQVDLGHEAGDEDEDDMLAQLDAQYKERFGMRWLGLYGFNNTYTVAVRGEVARQYGLEKTSDLAAVAQDLTFGGNPDYLERADGFPALCEAYGLDFGDVRDIDIGLKYTALASGDIDVTNAYTTDAQLANPDIDVVTLDDDLGLQVDYYCSTVVRSDTLERCPGLEEALMRMDGLISEADMARMNYLVEVEGQDERQVALDYLTAKGVL